MLEFLKNTVNQTLTENGAVTPRTTGSDCLNLLATVSALRTQSEAEIEKRFLSAFAENKDLAMKILFYARDVRGGLGERRVFRVHAAHLLPGHGRRDGALHEHAACSPARALRTDVRGNEKTLTTTCRKSLAFMTG